MLICVYLLKLVNTEVGLLSLSTLRVSVITAFILLSRQLCLFY